MKGQKLYEEAKRVIPGATQLFSKRAELFLPKLWPSYYSKAKGCKVWDLDGKEYLDFSLMGVGTAVLGYARREVDTKVIEAIKKGNLTTLNAPEEVKLAEKLLELHPWADMVRFAKTGGEAVTIAVRIARAKTNRDIVLFCGYHGWHDWYLSANLNQEDSLKEHLLEGLNPLGVPKALRGTAFPFRYNDVNALKELATKYKRDVACIIVEPIRNVQPTKEFIDILHDVRDHLKVPLIVDEISAGFRLTVGGAHKVLGIEPDIAVFGKAMSNGYPMSAVIGRAWVMDIAQDTFISSTYWTERSGLVASLETIRLLDLWKVPSHLINVGRQVKNIWRRASDRYGIEISIAGIDPIPNFAFNTEDPLLYKTLFTQLMLHKGFLASTLCFASYSHRKNHLRLYRKAVEETFYELSSKDPHKLLKTEVCHKTFRRLT